MEILILIRSSKRNRFIRTHVRARIPFKKLRIVNWKLKNNYLIKVTLAKKNNINLKFNQISIIETLHAERLFVLKRLFSDGMKILSGEDVRSIRILFPPYRISMENLFSGGEKKFSFSADGPLNSFDFDESRKLCSFNYAVLSRQVIISAERNGRTEATRELTTCSWTSFCW